MKVKGIYKCSFMRILVGMFLTLNFIECQDNSELAKNNDSFKKENLGNLISEDEILDKALDVFISCHKSNDNNGVDTYSEQLKDIENKEIKSISKVSDDSDFGAFYIINFKNGGFILLSCDKRMPEVLAFSSENEFNLQNCYDEDSSTGVDLWLGDMKNAFSVLRNENINILKDESKIQTYSGTTISYGPYISTTWGQAQGYNNLLPTCSSGQHVKVGCGPVAVSILIRHWARSRLAQYNWNNIPQIPITGVPSYETTSFIRDVYDFCSPTPDECKSTTTYKDNLIYALNQSGYYTLNASYFDANTVITEISYNRPVLLMAYADITEDGVTKSVGHAWICSGYKKTNGDDYFYMNWGWYSETDAFYYIGNNSLINNPKYQFYVNTLSMVYNITPL